MTIREPTIPMMEGKNLSEQKATITMEVICNPGIKETQEDEERNTKRNTHLHEAFESVYMFE